MTNDGGATSAPQHDADGGAASNPAPVPPRPPIWLTDGLMSWVMGVGLFVGLTIACVLLWRDGKLETDVSNAVSELLPFAVVWVGLIVGTNQLLKTTAATAIEPHERAQAQVYAAFLGVWNGLWPTLTTSIAVGYFTAVLADENPNALLAFIAVLLAAVFVVSRAAQRHLSPADLTEAQRDAANKAMVIRPVMAFAFLIPVFIIVAFVTWVPLTWLPWG